MMSTVRLLRQAQSALGYVHLAKIEASDWPELKARLDGGKVPYAALQARKAGPWALVTRGKVDGVETTKVHPGELAAALAELMAFDAASRH